MAAYFFDSSALAKRFIRETGTAFVLSLWRPSAHHAIYAARLTEVEVCAALARRHKISQEWGRACNCAILPHLRSPISI